jgi:hypothetical protein
MSPEHAPLGHGSLSSHGAEETSRPVSAALASQGLRLLCFRSLGSAVLILLPVTRDVRSIWRNRVADRTSWIRLPPRKECGKRAPCYRFGEDVLELAPPADEDRNHGSDYEHADDDEH